MYPHIFISYSLAIILGIQICYYAYKVVTVPNFNKEDDYSVWLNTHGVYRLALAILLYMVADLSMALVTVTESANTLLGVLANVGIQ